MVHDINKFGSTSLTIERIWVCEVQVLGKILEEVHHTQLLKNLGSRMRKIFTMYILQVKLFSSSSEDSLYTCISYTMISPYFLSLLITGACSTFTDACIWESHCFKKFSGF